MQTREDKLNAIVNYIEKAGLTFVEPFSLISATVVEASYWTGISKNTILVHINKVFKERYDERYLKAQKIAKEIAYGKNPDEEKIMSKDYSKELQPKTPKGRKSTTEIGVAFKEYTGLISKDNRGLYNACNNYYHKHHEFPWLNKERWKKVCERYGFEDTKMKE